MLISTLQPLWVCTQRKEIMGCYDCLYSDLCESAQGICPKYKKEPSDLSSLGFEPDYPTKAKKKQIQDSTQKKESAD